MNFNADREFQMTKMTKMTNMAKMAKMTKHDENWEKVRQLDDKK